LCGADLAPLADLQHHIDDAPRVGIFLQAAAAVLASG
jgi:hypothetical protein